MISQQADKDDKIVFLLHYRCKPGSSVSTVSDYGRGSIPDTGRGFAPLTSASRPALGPTQPPVHWVPGALTPGVKGGGGVMLTAHPLLVPRLRKSRSYTSCHPDAPLWSVTGAILPTLQFMKRHFYQCCLCICLLYNFHGNVLGRPTYKSQISSFCTTSNLSMKKDGKI
jgi:hypothetical protein